MILVFVLFWLVLLWGAKDGEIYLKEGAIFAAIWFALMAGFVFLPALTIWFIVGTVGLDIVLLMKVFGQNLPAW